MPDARSFAESLRRQDAGRDGDDAEARAGFLRERPTAQAFSLRLRFKDGRSAQGLPWALFAGYDWSDAGRNERLTLMFTARVVDIEGQYLWRLVEEIDDGQLKAVQEHNAAEIALLRSENADQRPGHQKPVIVSIAISPSFEECSRELRGGL